MASSRRAPAARRCRGCSAEVHFIASPKGRPQILDVAEVSIVTADGTVVRGWRSHWETCTKPPDRGGKQPEAAPPAPAPARRRPEPTPAQLAAAERLGRATVHGWYLDHVRAALVAAVAHPERQVTISLPLVSQYSDSQTLERESRTHALNKLRDLQALRVPVRDPHARDELVFQQVASELGEVGVRQELVRLTLALSPAVVREYLEGVS